MSTKDSGKKSEKKSLNPSRVIFSSFDAALYCCGLYPFCIKSREALSTNKQLSDCLFMWKAMLETAAEAETIPYVTRKVSQNIRVENGDFIYSVYEYYFTQKQISDWLNSLISDEETSSDSNDANVSDKVHPSSLRERTNIVTILGLVTRMLSENNPDLIKNNSLSFSAAKEAIEKFSSQKGIVFEVGERTVREKLKEAWTATQPVSPR